MSESLLNKVLKNYEWFQLLLKVTNQIFLPGIIANNICQDQTIEMIN